MAQTTIQVVQWSASAATLDLNLALSTALTKLRTYCNNNAANYDRVRWEVGVDLATGNFTFIASANVFPNTFASSLDAKNQLGLPTVRSSL